MLKRELRRLRICLAVLDVFVLTFVLTTWLIEIIKGQRYPNLDRIIDVAWAIIFIISVRLWRQDRELNRRRKNKLCMTCGYDPRGNFGPICPECGTDTTVQTEDA